MILLQKCRRIIVTSLCLLLIVTACSQQKGKDSIADQLKIDFAGKASIEVGSAFVGAEFHNSSFLPQRISFYYPVANSIDMNTDFWKRDTSFIMAAGLKIGDSKKEWLNPTGNHISHTPYSVVFTKSDSAKTIKVAYNFAKTKPAMIIEITITNESKNNKEFEFYTSIEASIKTCHTYKLIPEAVSQFRPQDDALIFRYDNPETDNARLFMLNVGEKPISWNTKSSADITPHKSTDEWYNSEGNLSEILVAQDSGEKPAFKFLYKKVLKPNESLQIVQVIGSTTEAELLEDVNYLSQSYKKEIADLESSILNKISGEAILKTNDKALDQSVLWSKAILETTQHYIDGDIIPMPCPAEYNFYFTHDVLVTDLAAVNYDLPRVKRDLEFIMKRSNSEKIIPHAYYFKDGKYQTEFADHDNWNNFWINIVTASYLRHSSDLDFANKLYPYLTKSIESSLRTLEKDYLMWSYRPDWWDIGKRYGAKTYMTSLAIRTLQDYIFISTALNKNLDKLTAYENMWKKMQQSLVENLWSEDQNFLINYYEAGKPDEHYYIGSLLPVYYGILDEQRSAKLLNTAKQFLVDENIGVHNAFPMDFENYGSYLSFAGNEAGAIGYYFNGGVWPQGNAWYALALIKNNQRAEAYKFIKNLMTIDGIMNGPNGQPAMYEVRNGNKADLSAYGSVDKPQFMWAGGWYLYCLYHLLLIDENPWNIAFTPYLHEGINSSEFTLALLNKNIHVEVSKSEKSILSVKYNDDEIPSLVIPANINELKDVKIETGKPAVPTLVSTEGILKSIDYSNGLLKAEISAFENHENTSTIISPFEVKTIKNNSSSIDDFEMTQENGYFKIKFSFIHEFPDGDFIEVNFKQ